MSGFDPTPKGSRGVAWRLLLTVSVLAAADAGAAQQATPVSPGAASQTLEIEAHCPTFSWGVTPGSAVTELAVYEIETGEGASPPRLVLHRRIAGHASSFTPARADCLEPGREYAWLVRSVPPEAQGLDASGTEATGSPWSDTLRFRVAPAPTEAELAEALATVRRFLERPDAARANEDVRLALLAETLRGLPAGEMGSGGEGPSSLLGTGTAAIRGENSSATGDATGVVGTTASPDGAGLVAANLAGGVDLRLDAQGAVDATLTEAGIFRSSAAAQSFEIGNPQGDLTLTIDGVEAVTTATDQDVLGALACASDEVAKWTGAAWACASDLDTHYAPGNQLELTGSTFAVLEGPGSGLDADTLDGLDASGFSPAGHLHDDRYFTETELSSAGGGGGVDWSNLLAVPAGFADGVDDVGSTAVGYGLVLVDGEIRLDPSYFSLQTPTIDTADVVGASSDIARAPDGLLIAAYGAWPPYSLRFAKCADLACANANVVEVGAFNPANIALEVGSDDLPMIAFVDYPSTLTTAHCSDASCSAATITPQAAWSALGTDLAIGGDGLPAISFIDSGSLEVRLMHCLDLTCSSATLNTLAALPGAPPVGVQTSIAIGTDGFPVVSYPSGASAFDTVHVAICTDADCGAFTTNAVSGIYTAFYSAVAIGLDGLPLVAFSVPIDRFALSRCLDGACSSVRTNVNPTATCNTASLVVGSDGRPAAACVSGVGDFVRVFRCLDEECYARPAILEIDIRHPVWGGYAGQDPSVCIGSDGRVVAGFFNRGKGEYQFALAPLGF